MATTKKAQITDVPYVEDPQLYAYFMSLTNGLKALQTQVDDLSSRVDKEGVITGGNDQLGWYAKFPNGIVLQGKFFSSNTAEHITWVFPLEFISTDAYCVACTPENWSYPSMCQCLQRTKTQALFKVHNNAGQGALGSAYHVMAFGRWK